MPHPRKPNQPKKYHGDDTTKRHSPKERKQRNKDQDWERSRSSRPRKR